MDDYYKQAAEKAEKEASLFCDRVADGKEGVKLAVQELNHLARSLHTVGQPILSDKLYMLAMDITNSVKLIDDAICEDTHNKRIQSQKFIGDTLNAVFAVCGTEDNK